MNIERFAGENPIMLKMAADLQQNEATMRQRQNEAMQQAYQARANDVAAAEGTRHDLQAGLQVLATERSVLRRSDRPHGRGANTLAR